MKRHFFCLLFPLLLWLGNNYSQSLVPLGFHEYEFTSFQPENPGHFLMTPFKTSEGSGGSLNVKSTLYVIDEKGSLVWYYQAGTDQFINFNYSEEKQVVYFNQRSWGGSPYIVLLDSLFFPVDTFTHVNSDPDIHEFQIITPNSFLISARRDSVMDLSGYLFNGSPGPNTANVMGFVVQEFDSLHNLVFDWNSNDHVHPSEMADGFFGFTNSSNFDSAHGNSIDKDENGNYYVSLRHTNCVYKIAPTGQILWRLGGENSDFTFTNDPAFSGQHDARFFDDGSVSLFDNSNTTSPHFTRGVRYSLDTINWTATKISEHYYTDTVYSRAMGSYQSCSDDSKVVNFGFLFRPSPSLIHLTDNNDLISSISMADSVISYRGYFIPNGVPGLKERPVISCTDSLNGKILSLPESYDHYLWNTGDTTSNIYVTSNGEYQCWVNKGTGMFGSESLNIDLAYDCSIIMGVDEVQPTNPPTVIAYYNLLGQQLKTPIKSGFYLIKFSDGSVKKEFIKMNN